MSARSYLALAIAGGCLLAQGFVGIALAACPSYTHHAAITGAVASLPDGWFVFAENGVRGLFKSDLKTYDATVIPGTAQDVPSFIDISDDGKWIVYLSSQSRIFMITPSGKGRLQIPVSTQSGGLTMVRFYNSSPKGNEIVYENGSGSVAAYSYIANDSVVTPGSERKILTISGSDFISSTEGLAAWKDQLLLEMFFTIGGNSISRPGYFTIPNNGSGTATEADLYTWNNTPDGDTTVWGCGHTISHDGLYTSSNAGFIGDTCVPCKHAFENGYSMEHKGVYIAHFLRQEDSAIEVTTIPSSPYAVSINWCPSDYWYGLYNEFDFDHENFTNNNQYLAIAQIGDGTSTQNALKGVWVLHWPDNTWTMLTPSTNPMGSAGITYIHPAIHFTAPLEVNRRLDDRANTASQTRVRAAAGPFAAIDLGDGVSGVTLYSLSGRELWSYHRSQSIGVQRVTAPSSIRGCMVSRYEFK